MDDTTYIAFMNDKPSHWDRHYHSTYFNFNSSSQKLQIEKLGSHPWQFKYFIYACVMYGGV
ncbi:hypothetical protein RchiOBHm_Chr4g0427261 [Rosa chinensis]|uniref:Uncharacterized protein n=1 Tax=Rosa chinensis TaxID=74649 RepID=A0A2P6QZL5_ROSCH|nr:hypothetical protein RchiOBHm_Chr4g0427261 [Rosa chinensis]